MGEIKSFACVVCPRSCALAVEADLAARAAAVSGNACPRGEAYGRSEALDPRRSLTTTVATAFPDRPRLPVKSQGEVPAGRLVEAVRSLDAVVVRTRARRGEVVVRDLLGLGVDLVATDDLADAAGGPA